MKALIVGAGIAGSTLAYWLERYGLECTIVEKAPRFRTGGYIIDFWGAGFEVAERMQLMPEIREKGYLVDDVRVVDGEGKRLAGFATQVFSSLTGGRYLSIPRSELAAAIFRKIENKVETVFGDSVARLEQTADGVKVDFDSGTTRSFDLVIGADGLHSRVRDIVFGPQAAFEKYLGYKVAAFVANGYQPRDELAYVMYTEVGQQIARFALRGDQTMVLFTFADSGPDLPSTIEAQKAVLRERFGNSGWESARILSELDRTEDLYFDRVSQIAMPAAAGLWTRGRVTLVGDAAFCVSLLAGQGSALAMVAAYILAGELHRAKDDYVSGFSRYQEIFGPFVLRKQKSALRFADTFAPKSRFSMFLRNRGMNLLSIPWIAEMFLGRDMTDRIALPDYQ